MKKLLFTAILFVSFFGFGQCPNAPILLSSQADVDAFQINYPGCTQLTWRLSISGNDITDLTPLNVIESMDTQLEIHSNAILENLNGLDNITFTGSVQTLEIRDNPMLTSIQGLQGITSITSGNFNLPIVLTNNPNLQSLNGLESLTKIEDLILDNNDSLVDLSGLDNIVETYGPIRILNNEQLESISELGNALLVSTSLDVRFNPLLESLNGLQNIELAMNNYIAISNNNSLVDISALASIPEGDFTSLNISNNPQLSVCNYPNICQFISNNPGVAQISDNAPGCNSEAEILITCQNTFYQLSGNIRFDFNMDGCDINDNPTNNLLILAESPTFHYTAITDNLGDYVMFLAEPGEYEISIAEESLPSNFEVSPSIPNVIFDPTTTVQERDICVIATQLINNLRVSLIPLNEARPGFDAEYQLIYENIGTTIFSGEVSLEFDDTRQTFLEATPMQDAIAGSQISWNYVDLLPFQSETITILFNTLPPPTNVSGDLLEFEAIINPIPGDDNPRDNIQTFQQTIVNSFDPNDKQVTQGIEIYENEVGDYLDYIVRFQNTGTASAINVRVEDVLSENLNWNTFRTLSSSHPYRVEIINDNEVSFIFDNINLPPEVTDPQGSNGFVAFQVQTLETLDIGDSVENTAHIFFDFNPAIITNTVVTIVAPNLSVDEFNPESLVRVYPNPVSEVLQIKLSDTIIFKGATIFSMLGEQLLISSEERIDVSNLSEGIYFITIRTDQGNITKKIVKQ